ncbi:MAG: hypothetical protein ABR549_03815 [Mycobacteriales bacterium]
MVMHPVGPLPASTYWRRRAVLLVVVVVVLLLLKSCAGGDGQKTPTGTTPRPTTTPSPTASPRPTSSRPPATAGGLCADSDLRLAVATDASTYQIGESPRFTLVITNTSAAACTRDLGSKVVSLQVVSGSARTWNSDDCTEGQDSKPTRLAPGKATTVVVLAWSGKRSQPGCPAPRQQAAAGTYQVSGTVGTLTSPRVVFHFR